jgi:hypothetical protein
LRDTKEKKKKEFFGEMFLLSKIKVFWLHFLNGTDKWLEGMPACLPTYLGTHTGESKETVFMNILR